MRFARIIAGLGLSVGLVAGGGCVSLAETPGEHFEKAMKRLAENCARHPPKPTDSACDPMKLKPADPLATEEGRFAHSIKIPNPLPEDSGYKPGMTPAQYFEHLCKTEAGEFIYKTVENVDGLYMMRPRREATDYELEHLYALEDPYGYTTGTSNEQVFGFVHPHGYQYIESPISEVKAPSWKKQYRDSSLSDSPPPGAKYARHFGFDARDMKSMKMEYDSFLKSRYGFTWRGISRPHDREMGIAGGELIIFELASTDVVAVRRGYIKSGHVENLTGVWWLKGQVCPLGSGRAEYGGDNFILKAMKPVSAQGDHNGSR